MDSGRADKQFKVLVQIRDGIYIILCMALGLFLGWGLSVILWALR